MLTLFLKEWKATTLSTIYLVLGLKMSKKESKVGMQCRL